MAVNIRVTAETVEAAARLQKFTTSAGEGFMRLSRAANDLGNRSKWSMENAGKLNAALGGLTRTATLFAGPAVQQVVYPLMLMGNELRTVAAGMKLTGLSFSSAVPAVAVMATAIIGLTQYIKMLNAQTAQFNSELNLLKQSSAGFKGVVDEIERAIGKGQITAAQGDSLLERLVSGSGQGPDVLLKTLRQVREEFVKLVPRDEERKALQSLQSLQSDLSVQALEGYAQQRAEANQNFNERKAQIEKDLAAVRVGSNVRAQAEQAANQARLEAETIFRNKMSAISAAEQQAKDAAYQKDLERVMAEYDAERLLRLQAGQQFKEEDEYFRAAELADQKKLLELEQQRAEAAKQRDALTFKGSLRNQLNELSAGIGNLAQSFASGTFQLIQQGLTGIGDAITGIITGTKTAGQAFAQFGMQMLTSFISMIVNALIWAYVAIPVLTALGVLTGGATATAGAPATIAAVSGALTAVSGMTGREHGGPVTAGQPYIVGERRPELFVPAQSGFILPSVPAGGGGREISMSVLIDRDAWLDSQRERIEQIAVDAMSRQRHRFSA